MGNCCSGTRGDDDQRSRPYVQLRQAQTWAKTGIVGLRDAGLKELPSTLRDSAASIRVIDASNNEIRDLPAFMSDFSGLQKLTLTRNLLATVAPTCCGLPALKLLLLDNNQLEHLPEEIGQLQKLERLSLAHNRLTRLPTALGLLPQLAILDVSHNRLHELPAQLGSCEQLEELNAQSNELAAVPAELGQLKKLKTLQLDNNQIVGVPSEVLYGCASLQTLSLHGCPIRPDDLHETPGFKEFEERRKQKYDKVLAGGALLGTRGLDEGVTRETAPR